MFPRLYLLEKDIYLNIKAFWDMLFVSIYGLLIKKEKKRKEKLRIRKKKNTQSGRLIGKCASACWEN